MKKTWIVFLIISSLLFCSESSFSKNKISNKNSKAYLLKEISLLNKEIRKIKIINAKSRNLLKKSKNKYAYEVYISFVNVYKTFLWCSDISHWLSQTYNDQDNMNSHIYQRLNANKKSIQKTLGYIAKVYGNINDVTLMHLIDTQEKVINSGLIQLDEIMKFLEKFGSKKRL